MFCPGCGIQITEDIKFCKNCGANLRGVREAMAARGEQFDWSKTWVAEMFMTEEEKERRRGVTPEQKRNNELRAGVITTAAGVGAMIFLYFFLGTVARVEGGRDAEIISRVWLAGVVPFLIGLALLFNGLFLRKREIQLHERESRSLSEQTSPSNQIPAKTTSQLLMDAETNAASRADFSVTEDTTAHLPEKVLASRRERE
jgi:hypothetical protein